MGEHADSGTLISSETWAIIWNEDQGWALLMPSMNDDELLPVEGQALMSFLNCEHNVPDFIEDMSDLLTDMIDKSSMT